MALEKEQARQAMYYNQRKVRTGREFRPNQLVWVYRPARGPAITKFGHRWRGPAQIVGAAGYDNFLIKMLESGKEIVTHCAFLLSYYYPTHLLDDMAADIATDIDPDDDGETPEIAGGELGDPHGPALTPAKSGTTESEATETRHEAGSRAEGDTGPRRAAGKRRAVLTQRDSEDGTDDDNGSGVQQPEQPPRRKRVRFGGPSAADARGDGVASRTRTRVRRAPYGNEPGSSGKQGDALGQATTTAAGDRESNVDGDDTRAASEAVSVHVEASADNSQQRGPPDEEDEERIYVFAGQGRHGVDRMVSRRARLTRWPRDALIRECRRRCYRTRTGRYILEFEVERVGGRPDPGTPRKPCINHSDYERLWREGRMRVGAEDGQNDDDDESREGDGGEDDRVVSRRNAWSGATSRQRDGEAVSSDE
ncbi:hypothetical protein PInf_005359 [Phytophthora infestans]|nr:hypothetical protein PInf_005359 [Phytophthora infestans]